jgi:hypothetical protein
MVETSVHPWSFVDGCHFVKSKGQTIIYKALHRKLKIEEHKPYKTPGVN